MHKKELVEAVARKTGKSKKDVKETLEAIPQQNCSNIGQLLNRL